MKFPETEAELIGWPVSVKFDLAGLPQKAIPGKITEYNPETGIASIHTENDWTISVKLPISYPREVKTP